MMDDTLKISMSGMVPALAPKAPKPDAKLQEAAKGFESLFLATLLKGGRSTQFQDELTGSSAVDSTRDMLDSALAQTGAEHTHLGIADAVARQFTPVRWHAHPGPYLMPKD